MREQIGILNVSTVAKDVRGIMFAMDAVDAAVRSKAAVAGVNITVQDAVPVKKRFISVKSAVSIVTIAPICAIAATNVKAALAIS